METKLDNQRDVERHSCIVVVMATYNGARFLLQQVESIQNQTHRDWRLIVRDDGSSDESVQIIRSRESADPRIELLEDRDHLGCTGSFSVLLQHALGKGADYILLADQDDVWKEDKLAVELEVIHEAEQRYGTKTPLLVHSDLTVVDAELHLICESFMSHCRLRHIPSNPLQTLLVENFVTGCTVIANRSLIKLATPLPKDVLVHDWWLAQCAAATGEIVFIPKSTILYRQHDRNSLGIRSAKKGIWHYLLHWQELTRIVARGVGQARQLLSRIEGFESPSTRTDLVRLFCRAFDDDSTRVTRLRLLVKSGIKRQRVIPHFGWLWAAINLPRSAIRNTP